MISMAIDRGRIAGKSVVLVCTHSSEPGRQQKGLESLLQHSKLTSHKQGPYVIEIAESVVPVKHFIEENFSDVPFACMHARTLLER